MADIQVQINPVNNLTVSLNAGVGGAVNFIDLLDTPSTYTGKANKLVTVKTDETGLDFLNDVKGETTITSSNPDGRLFTLAQAPNQTADMLAIVDTDNNVQSGFYASGGFRPVTLADASGNTHSIYYSNQTNRVSYKSSGGVISSFGGDNTGDETQNTIKTKLGTATTSTDGYLTSTDWNTFNNKQVSLGYTAENIVNKSDSYSVSSSTTYTTTKALVDGLATKEATITAGTTGQYYRGDKTFQTLDKTAVGLSNVDNTTDVNKPVSTATQTALNLKQNTLSGASLTDVTPASNDKILIQDTSDSDNLKTVLASSITGTPAGSNTQIQFNNNGVFGANSNLTWDNTNNQLVTKGNPTQVSPIYKATNNSGDSRFEVLGDNDSSGYLGFKLTGTNANPPAIYQSIVGYASPYTVVGADTVARFLPSSGAGLVLQGFSNSGSIAGFRQQGHVGGTTTTQYAFINEAFKHNGSGDRTLLSSTEKAYAWYNGAFDTGGTLLLELLGSGQATFSGQIIAPNVVNNGTAGAGYYGAIPQSSNPSTPASGFRLFADSTGKLTWIGTNGFTRTFDGTANTANQTYSLPNVSGTVALDTITTNRQTTSYTLVLADQNKLVELNNASANNLTVPLNATVAFPIGTQILLAQYGAGQTTIVATGGVTIRSSGAKLKLTGQYSGATLIKIATDEWYLFGDIIA
jgi:hypothetical protein